MTAKPEASSENSKSIFAENSLIELKYKNKEWIKGVILSSSRSHGIIIDLLISPDQFKQIKLYHSIAITYYYINKTLKPLNIKIPQQLFTIGTNIEYKYKNKEWKNGEIINIATNKLNETTIKIKKNIHKDKLLTVSRSKLIIDYIYNKTVKLTNKIYPFWISHDQQVLIRSLSEQHRPYEYYKIAALRDGKSMIFYKKSAKDAITVKHSEITQLLRHQISTKDYIIKPPNKRLVDNVKAMFYNFEIRSDTVNATKDLMCHGFVKKNYTQYVTTVIVQLIAQYVSDILEDMKHAIYKQAFYTNLVSIKSFNWYLTICPNGYDQKGLFQIFLCLQSLPKQLKWVKVYWEIKVKETGNKFGQSSYGYRWSYSPSQFARNSLEQQANDYAGSSYNYRSQSALSLEKIQDLKQLTFELSIKYDSVLDENKKFMKFDEHYYTNPILN